MLKYWYVDNERLWNVLLCESSINLTLFLLIFLLKLFIEVDDNIIGIFVLKLFDVKNEAFSIILFFSLLPMLSNYLELKIFEFNFYYNLNYFIIFCFFFIYLIRNIYRIFIWIFCGAEILIGW